MAGRWQKRLLAAGICLWLCAECVERRDFAFAADPLAAASVVDFESRPLSPHFFPGKRWAMFGEAERLTGSAPLVQPLAESRLDPGVAPSAIQPRLSPHFFSGEIGLTSDEHVPEAPAPEPAPTTMNTPVEETSEPLREVPRSTAIVAAHEFPIRLPGVVESEATQTIANPPSAPNPTPSIADAPRLEIHRLPPVAASLEAPPKPEVMTEPPQPATIVPAPSLAGATKPNMTQPSAPRPSEVETISPARARLTAAAPPAPRPRVSIDELDIPSIVQQPSTAKHATGVVVASQPEVPHYFAGVRKPTSRVPEYLNPALPAMLADSQPITEVAASKLAPNSSSRSSTSASAGELLPRLANIIKPNSHQPFETQLSSPQPAQQTALVQPAPKSELSTDEQDLANSEQPQSIAKRSMDSLVTSQPEIPHYFAGVRKPASRIPEYLNLTSPAIFADCQPITKRLVPSIEPKSSTSRVSEVAKDSPRSPGNSPASAPAAKTPFRLASVTPQGAPKPAPQPAAVQPAALPAPRADLSRSDDTLVSLSPRNSSPHKPLQPAEVFSIPRPDFFAEEIRQTGLDARLPAPAGSLGSAEVSRVRPASATIESQFQLTALRQRLPASDASLQPAEVLPIPIPDNPTAPRIPALDQDRPIGALTTNIMTTAGKLPQDVAADKFRGDYPPWAQRPWNETAYFWDAPSLCYGGLRYEEVNLERFGYGHCHLLQPFVSAAHFAGSTVALPYNIATHPPWECIYPLGHYRPGSPVPYRKIWPDLSLPGSAAEAGTIAGLILLIP